MREEEHGWPESPCPGKRVKRWCAEAPNDSKEDERVGQTPLPKIRVMEGKGQGSIEILTCLRNGDPTLLAARGARARVGCERRLGAGMLRRPPSQAAKGEGSHEALRPGDAQQDEVPLAGRSAGTPAGSGRRPRGSRRMLDGVRLALPPRARGGEAERPPCPQRGPARGSGAQGRRGPEADKLSAPRPPPSRCGGAEAGAGRGPGSGGDARSGWGRRRPSLRRLLLLAGPGPRPPAPRPSAPAPARPRVGVCGAALRRPASHLRTRPRSALPPAAPSPARGARRRRRRRAPALPPGAADARDVRRGRVPPPAAPPPAPHAPALTFRLVFGSHFPSARHILLLLATGTPSARLVPPPPPAQPPRRRRAPALAPPRGPRTAPVGPRGCHSSLPPPIAPHQGSHYSPGGASYPSDPLAGHHPTE